MEKPKKLTKKQRLELLEQKRAAKPTVTSWPNEMSSTMGTVGIMPASSAAAGKLMKSTTT